MGSLSLLTDSRDREGRKRKGVRERERIYTSLEVGFVRRGNVTVHFNAVRNKVNIALQSPKHSHPHPETTFKIFIPN